MTNYAVFLEGEDFELTRDGGKDLFGFFVTVRVEAESVREAEREAIELIKSDPTLAEAFKSVGKEALRINSRVVHQLLPENRMDKTEYTFFPMEEI